MEFLTSLGMTKDRHEKFQLLSLRSSFIKILDSFLLIGPWSTCQSEYVASIQLSSQIWVLFPFPMFQEMPL
uniref:Putative ovule protein n=1 Tax=Solanum chacoense TaxID=4108 RepID=A0A0V0HCE6_SOLCH